MIFDELPFEIKEHIFLYVSPDDWMNTAKVSKEWLELTLGSIKTVQSCHLLVLDHLAEFINQQKNTSYTWVSLLALMPKLERLECFENTEDFWNAISQISQLKVLQCQPINTVAFDWNQLEVSFKNLTELVWHGCYQRVPFPLKWFELAPNLEKITLKSIYLTPEWQKKIPKAIKHIVLDVVVFLGEYEFSTNFICQDPSTVETFCVVRGTLRENASLQEFHGTPRLKSLEFNIYNSPPSTSVILCNAFKKCPRLETVKAYGVTIDDSWRRAIPENVKSIYFRQMQVREDIRSDFSYDWLFENYGCLQSFNVRQFSWTQFHAEKFCSSDNLIQLSLDNSGPSTDPLDSNAPIDPFSDICAHMIRCSHLADVTLNRPVVYESWRHIFPPTVKKLKLQRFALSQEARKVFSPQFICENPCNLEIFSIKYKSADDDPLPAMNLSAFIRMNKLQELHLIYSSVSRECLKSILGNCFALTDLVVRELKPDAISNLSSNFALPNVRNLRVKATVDQPSKLLQHFPKLRTVNIPIVASEQCSRDFIYGLRGVETAEIKMKKSSWNLLHSLLENIDDAKFKYFCLSHGCEEFSFYLTNSLMDACRKLYRFSIQKEAGVLWIKNYPTSPLLRKNVSESLPSNMDVLSQEYSDIMATEDNES